MPFRFDFSIVTLSREIEVASCLFAAECGIAMRAWECILQLAATHADSIRVHSNQLKRRRPTREKQEGDNEMQRPATRVGPMTIASASTSASSTRDLVNQRQPAVHVTIPPVVSPSTQQSNASTITNVETDQPLREPLEQYRSKELRKEVSRLKLKVNRHGGPEGNDHKHGYIALIREFHRGTSKMYERANFVENMRADAVRDSQSPAHADPTIK